MHKFYFGLSRKCKHLNFTELFEILPVVKFRQQIYIVHITSFQDHEAITQSHLTFQNKLLFKTNFFVQLHCDFPRGQSKDGNLVTAALPKPPDCLQLWQLMQWGDFVSTISANHFNCKSQHAPLASALAHCATYPQSGPWSCC